jgi:hypothetical protein
VIGTARFPGEAAKAGPFAMGVVTSESETSATVLAIEPPAPGLFRLLDELSRCEWK